MVCRRKEAVVKCAILPISLKTTYNYTGVGEIDMKGKLLALCLSGLLLAALPTAWAGQNQPLIDCDAGGDLARDLPRAVAAGFSTIYLRGACTGNFVIDTPRLKLRGDPSATIQGIDSGGPPRDPGGRPDQSRPS